MDQIQNLQREIYRNYAKSVELAPDASYLHGTQLKPVVPLDTAVGGLFILGAYPSARFAQIDGTSDVPVADNLGPFESERWFDGSRVRKQPSARELEDLFLRRMGIERGKCWITDLVKVFLFKPGHVKRYKKLKASAPDGYTRDRFFELGVKSLPWITKELEIARPKLVVTLGAEVAGVLHGVKSAPAQTKLISPEVRDVEFGSVSARTIHCAHPGILMRKDGRNPWPKRHEDEFVPALRRAWRE
jgi:uracil-DNA glycosylase